MLAVIKTGGKQYSVQEGLKFSVEKLPHCVGDTIEFSDVLLVTTQGQVHVGNPFVPGAKVTVKLIEQIRGEKVIVFKKKRRNNYRRKNGHRQSLSVIQVEHISV